MSTSSKAAEPPARGRRAGFTLLEALVALAVAGLVLPALGRALAGAWSADRAPMEAVSALALAGGVAAGGAVPPEARAAGYAAERETLPATVLVLPSEVAPAPPGAAGDDASELRPEATPAAIRLAAPKSAPRLAGAVPPAAALRRVAVSVRAPSGRLFVLDALRLDVAPP